MADAEVIELAGREVRITSPGKVLFSERGETKLDLVRYYAAVADPLLRTMGGRPVLMQRFPQGASGKSFFQKRVPDSAPDWLQTTTVETVNGTPSRALVAVDVAHVAWAVNLACLGFHVWPHRADDPAHADELRLDLGPQPGTGFAEARAAAWELKALLGELGIAGFPKTTGNRGLHVYVRLEPRAARLRPPGAALGLVRAPRRGVGAGARARAPPARHPHRGVVEGGAGRADLRRLQPERAAQDGVRRVVGPRPAGRAGLGPAALGRARRGRPRRADDRERPGAAGARRRSLGRDRRRAAVARAAAGAPRARPRERPARRAVAAGLPQAAGRAAEGGAEPGAARRLSAGAPDAVPAAAVGRRARGAVGDRSGRRRGASAEVEEVRRGHAGGDAGGHGAAHEATSKTRGTGTGRGRRTARATTASPRANRTAAPVRAVATAWASSARAAP